VLNFVLKTICDRNIMHSQDEGVIATNTDASICKRYLKISENLNSSCLIVD
jgi:hypothetical protein